MGEWVSTALPCYGHLMIDPCLCLEVIPESDEEYTNILMLVMTCFCILRFWGVLLFWTEECVSEEESDQ
ncbi:CMF_collapsed_G0013020.mRNA.1.CDS.1 [Saccharomyces cerevisiae]|nr:CMF_collapsed_G0013020.mRNA.1.CDS.1 [Saccharomyces cerevisiae]